MTWMQNFIKERLSKEELPLVNEIELAMVDRLPEGTLNATVERLEQAIREAVVIVSSSRSTPTRLSVSFSGGRSSAAMCYLILTHSDYTHFEKQFIFANTGMEHQATLDFVDRVDKHFGLNLVWVEGVIQEGRKSPDYFVTDYEHATRTNDLFLRGCTKFGLFNPDWKWCTRDLKRAPMDKYRRDTGFGDATVAVGIRGDELDRIGSEPNVIYPLFDHGWTKATVAEFWKRQPFDLEIPSDAYGNCVCCPKKSIRKLATLALEAPALFEPYREMEERFSFAHNYKGKEVEPNLFVQDKKLLYDSKTKTVRCLVCDQSTTLEDLEIRHEKGCKNKKIQPQKRKPRHFYRGQRTVEEIFEIARDLNFAPYSDKDIVTIADIEKMNQILDIGGDCDQGCEAYG